MATNEIWEANWLSVIWFSDYRLSVIRFSDYRLSVIWISDYRLSVIWFSDYRRSVIWFSDYRLSMIWFSDYRLSVIWFSDYRWSVICFSDYRLSPIWFSDYRLSMIWFSYYRLSVKALTCWWIPCQSGQPSRWHSANSQARAKSAETCKYCLEIYSLSSDFFVNCLFWYTSMLDSKTEVEMIYRKDKILIPSNPSAYPCMIYLRGDRGYFFFVSLLFDWKITLSFCFPL